MSYDEFPNRDVIRNAVARNIEIIDEVVKRLSDEIKNKYSEIE